MSYLEEGRMAQCFATSNAQLSLKLCLLSRLFSHMTRSSSVNKNWDEIANARTRVDMCMWYLEKLLRTEVEGPDDA